jgi:hypothetical protein
MSEIGHTEYKHAHDHKDIDIFVKKENVSEVVMILQQEDFQKVWTRYDHLPSEENFRRYEKTVETENGKFHRVTVDFFERNDLETVESNGFTVVKPEVLLSFTEIFIPVINVGQSLLQKIYWKKESILSVIPD